MNAAKMLNYLLKNPLNKNYLTQGLTFFSTIQYKMG